MLAKSITWQARHTHINRKGKENKTAKIYSMKPVYFINVYHAVHIQKS